MTSKLNRENGEVLILTERELNLVYGDARVAWMKDYVCDLLSNRGFDPGEIGDEKIEEITDAFINNMDAFFGDSLHELEDKAFDYTIADDFPEYEEE